MEAADRPTVLDALGCVGIISWDRFEYCQRSSILFWLARLDKLGYIPQYGQTTDAQQVDLDQSQCFHRLQVELCNCDALAAGAHHRHQFRQSTGRYDQAAGMHRQVARQFEQGFGLVENQPVGRVRITGA